MNGKFISFEGPDGAGKTSVLQAIGQELSVKYGDDLVLTREPGGNKISESIRNIILDSANTEMDARTEALLYAAARRQHLKETVIPALESGKIVISDRYVDSSIAYQGAGRSIGEDEVWQMNQFAIDGLEPDLTVYLDIESEEGLRRIKTYRTDEINRLDVEDLEFHQRVRSSYLKLAKENSDRIKLVDASQPLEKVLIAVKATMLQKYPNLF
ncbi:thymidylate kinase [Paucilactobacillus oligofermentans DSM 15707 = LMG 22743]|uniref:Thymidylate kinase n=1 Tax=Paucilactobacillus oligofermentans DSM 15707 = LMG 22743 TaxID=1423778 RepID=A0A0R1RLZ0_9LACO|nr:dTMP kinase [Paucilactobacillus oligofermentans]KRL57804.1 thymidylate kinase [Paucilactobacillus oligofermentans DSM 15707 = LMG 22743]CUS26739.1 dTMP kinase [Paucilactobacillus oligofermentans DSM 15707 = LMG 22743]